MVSNPVHVCVSFRWGTILSFIYYLFVFHSPAELRYGTVPVRLRAVHQGAVEVRRGVRLLRQLGRGRLQRRWVSADQMEQPSLLSPLWGSDFGGVRFRFEERKGKRIKSMIILASELAPISSSATFSQNWNSQSQVLSFVHTVTNLVRAFN